MMQSEDGGMKTPSYTDLPAETVIVCPKCKAKNLRTDNLCRNCEKDLTDAKNALILKLSSLVPKTQIARDERGGMTVGGEYVISAEESQIASGRITHRTDDAILGVDNKILIRRDERLEIAVECSAWARGRKLGPGVAAVTDKRFVFLGTSRGYGESTCSEFLRSNIESAEVFGVPKRCRMWIREQKRHAWRREYVYEMILKKDSKDNLEQLTSALNALIGVGNRGVLQSIEIERKSDELQAPVPIVEMEMSMEYGSIKRGLWGTVRFELKNKSSFPVEIKSLTFPNEIRSRGGMFPISMSPSSTANADIGILSSDAGRFPICVRAAVQWPASPRTRDFDYQFIMDVVPFGASEGLATPASTSLRTSASAEEERSCQNCQGSLNPKWRYCPHCGSNAESRAFMRQSACPTCGKSTKPQWKKCPYCATRL
jgi:RNA polymerase subunit RPABC4/transcription elongation factor Spt4